MKLEERLELQAVIEKCINEQDCSKGIAEKIGLSYSVFRNQLNTHNELNKLGLHTIVEVLDHAESKYFLRWLCNRYGYTPVQQSSQTEQANLDLLMTRAHSEHGDIAKQYYAAMLDGTLKPEEIDELLHEVQEDIDAKMDLKQSLLDIKKKIQNS